MKTNNPNKTSRKVFSACDKLLKIIPWVLLIIALLVLFCIEEQNKTWHDLALSYIAGMIVYIFTVLLPEMSNGIKLKRHVFGDLANLYNVYKDLLWTISNKADGNDPYSLEQIQEGLEQRFNCWRHSKYICLSVNTVDILKPKCKAILDCTSTLITKHYALSTEELLVIHEITSVWLLKEISELAEGSDYRQLKEEINKKAEYLVLRYKDYEKIYFAVKNKTRKSVGWHPA